MSSRRNDIIAFCAAALAEITIANSYHQDVETVERVIAKDPRGIKPGQLPWLGVAPSPERQPEGEFFPGRRKHQELFLHVQGVVGGQPGEERQQAVSELARDVEHKLLEDQTCGANATEILTVMGPWADDGAPDLVADGGRGTFHFIFRVIYPVDLSAKTDA